MEYVKISVRSLLLRWRQYFSLFMVCAVGTAVSMFLIFAVQGMLGALNMKAKIYYGGDYQFFGGIYSSDFGNGQDMIDAIRPYFPDTAIISQRLDFDADNSAYYFEGVGVRQRVVKGIDFTTEAELFKRFNYVAGSAAEMAGTNGVLLSEPIAEMLECSVGDEVTFMLKNLWGYTNTVPLIVKGIFKDSSLFGMYTSYLDIDVLRKAQGYGSTFANRVCIFFPDGEPTAADTARYQTVLSEHFTMHPQVKDKREFYNKLGTFSEPTYALLTLGSNMNDLAIIIEAMRAITALVIVVLVIIIVVGISSTYKVIIMKRINEIGIYKSIGMKRGSIYTLIGFETLALLASGCVAGILLSQVLCGVIQLFDFTVIPAFDVFLTNGVLKPIMSTGGMFGICALVIVTTLIAVLFSVRTAVKKMPSEALATTA